MTTKRTQVMIKGEFQQRLIMNTLLITLITLNLIILMAFALDNMFGSTDSYFNVFNISVALLELVAVVIVYFIGRKISFQIAGPLYAMERTLYEMEEGNLGMSLKLRPGDEFSDLALAVNEVLTTYRQRVGRIQEIAGTGGELSPQEIRDLRLELRFFNTASAPPSS
ncbi:MAG: methyl-accepting chemotaxis protein [Halieaceae bacterium]